jgi:hypothetical protein
MWDHVEIVVNLLLLVRVGVPAEYFFVYWRASLNQRKVPWIVGSLTVLAQSKFNGPILGT